MKNDTLARRAYALLIEAENMMKNAGCMASEPAYDAVKLAIKSLNENIVAGAFLPSDPEEAKRVTRARLRGELALLDYVTDGNHVFTRTDYAAITQGRFRQSVTENPCAHPAHVVRKAEQLAKTYA